MLGLSDIYVSYIAVYEVYIELYTELKSFEVLFHIHDICVIEGIFVFCC